MGNDGSVVRFAGHFHGFDGFGDGADLIQFDEDGVGDFFRNAAGENFRIGDEDVVADKLN